MCEIGKTEGSHPLPDPAEQPREWTQENPASWKLSVQGLSLSKTLSREGWGEEWPSSPSAPCSQTNVVPEEGEKRLSLINLAQLPFNSAGKYMQIHP
jgi:hypothetical protein